MGDSRFLLSAPASESDDPWHTTAAGIAVITICSILGLLLLAGLVAGGLYVIARKKPVHIPETGPDVIETLHIFSTVHISLRCE